MKFDKNVKFLLLIFILIIPISFADDIDCIEEWECDTYSICDGEHQYRTCTELNSCDYIENKPETVISCGYYLTEPASCGNGIIEKGETYLNCNKDINITINNYISCIQEGELKCVYYKEYLTNTIFYAFIGVCVLYYFFGQKEHKK